MVAFRSSQLGSYSNLLGKAPLLEMGPELQTAGTGTIQLYREIFFFRVWCAIELYTCFTEVLSLNTPYVDTFL